MIAYWCKDVAPQVAFEAPVFQRILYAGPWKFVSHPQGGAMAIWGDWPEKGQQCSTSPDAYGEPRDCGDGLWYYPPKVTPDFWDLARGDRTGVDLKLSCGKTISVQVATSQHRQFRISPGPVERLGDPITEYGLKAIQLLEKARKENRLDDEDPDLWRVIALALGQCYRSTPELTDDTRIFARDDIDSILGVIWWGDPKALSPALPVAAPDSPSLESSTSTSAPATP